MQALTTISLTLALSAVFALPSLLAIMRKHPRWLAITIVNILFGWTVIGWVVALAWVVRPAKARKPRRKRDAKPRRARSDAAAANDNVFWASPADALLPVPAADDSNVYEEWLEDGSALSDAGTSGARTTGANTTGANTTGAIVPDANAGAPLATRPKAAA